MSAARADARHGEPLRLLALLLATASAARAYGVATSDGGLALSSHGALEASGIVAGVVLIVVGLFMAFVGYRLLKALVLLAGFCAVGGMVLYAECLIRPPHEGEHARSLWYLAIAAVVGAAAGGALQLLFRAGIALVGALGGFAVASWILAMRSGGAIHSSAGRALLIIALIAAGIAAALFLQRPAVIVLSSVWGSYALFVGIDCFARTGFRSTALAFLGAPGAVYATSPGAFAMIAGMALTTLLGVFVQFRLTAKSK
ncbi:hypothetical protein H4R21_003091 [Coemansia helicoidea]|uniref:Uncharacterized protein n=1 Tax=Coemansia helicoidea TaxID=1286919 RepID=A0ACC1L4G8_9FUNG|nr:hypothetical protein H4R21_003091 [Coemansia helicoidea]